MAVCAGGRQLSPPFGFETNNQANALIVSQINDCRPDVLIVGLGFPKTGAMADGAQAFVASSSCLGNRSNYRLPGRRADAGTEVGAVDQDGVVLSTSHRPKASRRTLRHGRDLLPFDLLQAVDQRRVVREAANGACHWFTAKTKSRLTEQLRVWHEPVPAQKDCMTNSYCDRKPSSLIPWLL